MIIRRNRAGCQPEFIAGRGYRLGTFYLDSKLRIDCVWGQRAGRSAMERGRRSRAYTKGEMGLGAGRRGVKPLLPTRDGIGEGDGGFQVK